MAVVSFMPITVDLIIKLVEGVYFFEVTGDTFKVAEVSADFDAPYDLSFFTYRKRKCDFQQVNFL